MYRNEKLHILLIYSKPRVFLILNGTFLENRKLTPQLQTLLRNLKSWMCHMYDCNTVNIGNGTCPALADLCLNCQHTMTVNFS